MDEEDFDYAKAFRIAGRIKRAVEDANKMGMVVFVDGWSGYLTHRWTGALREGEDPEVVMPLGGGFASGQFSSANQ